MDDIYGAVDYESAYTTINTNWSQIDLVFCAQGDEDWYVLSLTETTEVTIAATAGTGIENIDLYVYAGDYEPGDSAIDWNYGYPSPELTLTLEAGTYLIRLNPYDGFGTYDLDVTGTVIETPTNVDCASAEAIDVAALPFTDSGFTIGGGDEYQIPLDTCGGSYSQWGEGAPDVVYSLTPTADGTFLIELSDLGFDAVLYVVSDCSDIGNSCLDADDNYSGESLTLDLTSGTTYYIVVDGFGSDDSGAYTLTVNEIPTCVDDTVGVPTYDDGNIHTMVLPETLTDLAFCTEGEEDWFTFTLAADTEVEICGTGNLTLTEFDIYLYADGFTGNSDYLAHEWGDDFCFQRDLTAGTYYLRAAQYTGTGFYQLSLAML